jgi:hypothetical protein
MIKRTRVPKNLKSAARNILVLILGVLVAFLALEAVVRFYPSDFWLRYLEGTGTFKHSQFDANVGIMAFPNQKGSRCADCLRIYPIYSNSLGFRGNNWSDKKGFKIAILGDSCLEGLEVSDSDNTSAILGKLLNQEVLNAAIGASATLKQVAIYKKFLRPLKPDLVLLFFLPENDILENSCQLTELLYGRDNTPNPCGYFSGSEIKVRAGYDRSLSRSAKSGIREFIKENCQSCILVNRAISQAVGRILYKADLDYYQVYLPAKRKEWKEGWLITEKALLDLKQEIEKDGGRLVVFIIPGWCTTVRDTKEIKKVTGFTELPEGFDLDYPVNLSKDFMAKQSMHFLSLRPYLLEYRDKFNLEFPFFSYRCEPHWNPLGHFIISHIVAKYLLENGWIPFSVQEKDRLLKKIEFDLALPPREILGESAYRQIYNRAFYRGHSDITKILRDD